MYKQMTSVLKQYSDLCPIRTNPLPYMLPVAPQSTAMHVCCALHANTCLPIYTPIIVTQDKLNCMVYTLLRVGNVTVRICCGLQYIMAYMGSHKHHTALKIGAQSYAHTDTTHIELMLTCRTCGGTPSASPPLLAHSPLCTLGTQRLQCFQ